MKFLKKNFLLSLACFFVLIFPLISLSDSTVPVDSGVTITNPINSGDITTLVTAVLQGVVKIALPILALAIIYSGFLFVAAQGKPEDLDKARKSLLYTSIGAAILLGAYAIAELISETVKSL